MKIDIYQVFYKEEQAQGLDPAFIPFDNLSNLKPEEREFPLLEQLYSESKPNLSDLCGLVSPKFFQKSKLRGDQFLQWIESNPGYEAYCVNPFPQDSYIFLNYWEQAAYFHPAIIGLTQSLFDNLGLKIDLRTFPRQTKIQSCMCNFWVGNSSFWKRYMDFAIPVSNFMKSSSQRAKYFKQASPDYPAPYYAFIMERLFPTFLQLNNVKYLMHPFQDNWLFTYAITEPQYYFVKNNQVYIDMLDASTSRIPDDVFRTFFDSNQRIFNSLERFGLTETERAQLFTS